MWFEVAPEGKIDIFIGFQGFSFEEIIIGLYSALMVFPLNLFFLILFRKSREKVVSDEYMLFLFFLTITQLKNSFCLTYAHL